MNWHTLALLSSVTGAAFLFFVLQMRRQQKQMAANLKKVIENPSMIDKVVRVLVRVDRARCYDLVVHTTDGKKMCVADSKNYEEVEIQLDAARMKHALAATQ